MKMTMLNFLGVILLALPPMAITYLAIKQDGVRATLIAWVKVIVIVSCIGLAVFLINLS
jgi:hypothetical protein